MRVIIINGRGGSGKDTVCQMVSKFSPYGASSVSTVEIVKEWASTMMGITGELCGWDGKKDERGRRLLAQLKDVWEEYDSGPTKWVVKMTYGQAKSSHPQHILFIHAREPMNIWQLREELTEFNPVTMLVTRPEVGDHGNSADDNVNNFAYDFYIDNDGPIEKLESNVLLFLLDFFAL